MTTSDQHAKKRATMAKNLHEQTGRRVEDWVDIVRQSDAGSFKEIVDWLKSNHQLGHFQARLVAEAARDEPSG